MPTEVPPEHLYSLNQAADHSGMKRDDFRKLIGEFEQKAGQLPFRMNEHGEKSKFVPASLLHIFEEAVLWMRTYKMDEAGGMSHALGMRRTDALDQLANAVADREPLLRLPDELRAAAQELKTVFSRPLTARVRIMDQMEVASSIRRLGYEMRLERWTLAALVASACLLGAVSGVTFTLRTMGHRIENVEARVNQSQYEIAQQLGHIEKGLKTGR